MIVAALIAAALVLTLAIPYGPWRTGRMELEPLAPLPAQAAPPPAKRLWIDTDAACGHGPRTDPDDCLALLALIQGAGKRIAGISTVAGNAPLEITDRTTRALVEQFPKHAIPVHTGSAAQGALRVALEDGQLTLVALGPLTNIALALHGHPELAAKVERLVAVMGRRPGHLFHPAEGAPAGMLFGHGPVFTDFNFAQDAEAAARVLALDIPITLIPYDAARHVEITAADLDRLAARGGAHAWVAERSRAWLAFWQEDIGRRGFYPFDLLAAAYAVAPRRLNCARVTAAIAKDFRFLLPWRDKALLVAQREDELDGAARARAALYCPGLQPGATLAGILWP